MSLKRYVAGVVPILFWLFACQPDQGTPTLSLGEAKRVTAEFQSQGFTPPPRTIRDITEVLDRHPLTDPNAAEHARDMASREPTPDLKGISRALFFWQRGRAAKRIGRVDQEVDDMREAIRLAEGLDRHKRVNILWDLISAEKRAGHYVNVVRRGEEFIDQVAGDAPSFALKRIAQLATIYAQSGDLDRADQVLALAEDKLVKVRDFPKTDQFSERRKQAWKREGRKWTSSVDSARAKVLSAKGVHRQAEPLYRSALATAEDDLRIDPNNFQNLTKGTKIVDDYQKDLAMNLMRQGRVTEAEVELRKALVSTLGRVGRYSSETASMVGALAKIVQSQGRYAETEELARALIDIQQKIGAPKDSLNLALARDLLIDALVNQGKWRAAQVEIEAIQSGLANEPHILDKFFGTKLSRAAVLVKNGRSAEAVPIAERALEKTISQRGKNDAKTAIARGILSAAQAETGNRREALEGFMEAVPNLLSLSHRSESDDGAQSVSHRLLAVVLDSYIGLLVDIRGTELQHDAGIDAVAEAFRIADAARARAVRQALSASGARAAANDPDLADLARREQDSSREISSLKALLADVLSQPQNQQNEGMVTSLRERIGRLRSARAVLVDEIESRFPDYAELIDPRPATIEDVRTTLKPGEALLATYSSEKRTYVWAIPQAGSIAFSVADLGRSDLADLVGVLRATLEPNAQTLGDIPEFDLAIAYDLYANLMAPVEAGWKAADSLLVVAHGPLGYLPLSLLPTKPTELEAESGSLFSNYRNVPWLVRSHAITVLPSVSSLRTLRALPPGSTDRRDFAGFGDPYFNAVQAAKGPIATAELTKRGLATRGLSVRFRAAPNTADLSSAELSRLPRLPDTAEEITSIAEVLGAEIGRDVFLGTAANEQVVKTADLSSYKVLAFATHGLVPGDLDGLTQPALALSSPDVAGVDGDGLLTMDEIMSLRLDADWVVLSACNTASGDGAGAEAVSGLGQAFFYAGTRALLASNWPVETTSAKALTTDLFRRQRDKPSLARSEALRQAMEALIDGPGYVDPETGKAILSYAHPIFWAPFSIIGDGGGGLH